MSTEAKTVTAIIIITLLIIVGGIAIMSGQSGSRPDVVVNSDILVRPDSPIRKAEQDHITIVEFADYECPSCAVLHPTLEKLLASENGKYITYVFRNFPLHAGSVQASVVVQAAGAQGKYWEMHDLVFRNQDEWASVPASNKAARATIFAKYAESLGLDITAYSNALNDGKYESLVKRDQADAIAMNIGVTPTMIINGTEVVEGAVSYEKLEEIVKAELAKND